MKGSAGFITEQIKDFTVPVKFISRDHGLPSSQVQDFIQDSSGNFWIAGPSGLARYNGESLITLGRSAGLRSHSLRAITQLSNGEIWLGSDVGIDIIRDGEQISPHPRQAEWQYGYVDTILEDRQGCVWINSAAGLVRYCEAGFSPVQFGIDTLIPHLAQDGSGNIWIYTQGHKLKFHDGQVWRDVDLDIAARVGRVALITTAQNGTLAVIGEHDGIRIDASGQVQETLDFLMPDVPITALLWLENELWVATSGYLHQYMKYQNGWELKNRLLESSKIKKLYRDDLDNIWGGTGNQGMFKVSTLRHAILQPHLPELGAGYSIRRHNGNQILLGCEHGAALISFSDVMSASRFSALEGHRVWELYCHDDGNYWAATDHGPRVFDSDGNEITSEALQRFNSACRTITGFGGEIYLGTVRGAYRLVGDELQELYDARGKGLGYVYTLKSNENLWIGTIGNGLWTFSEQGVERFQSDNITTNGSIYGFDFGAAGELVVAQDNQVIIVAQDSEQILVESEHEVAAWSVLVDSQHDLWLGTSSGLQQCSTQYGTMRRSVIALMGLTGWEFTTSRSLRELEGNWLACATNSGMIFYQNDMLSQIVRPISIKLTSVDFSNANVKVNDQHYVLDEGKWQIRVKVHTAWFVEEENLRYRFRLVGFDETWSPSQRRPVSSFNSLPAGDYRLEAQAFSPLMGWGTEQQLITLSVNATNPVTKFVQRCLRLVGNFMNRINTGFRNIKLFQLNQQLTREIRERTQALEIANAQLQIANEKLVDMSNTDSLTEVANKRALRQKIFNEVARSSRDKLPLSLLMIDIDFFKQYNDYFGHVQGDRCLQQVAAILAEHTRTDSDMVARYGGEEFVIVLHNTDQQSAMQVASKLQERIADAAISHPNSDISTIVTASMGVTTWEPSSFEINRPSDSAGVGREAYLDLLLSKADEALYEAKRSGRNQVRFLDFASKERG